MKQTEISEVLFAFEMGRLMLDMMQCNYGLINGSDCRKGCAV